MQKGSFLHGNTGRENRHVTRFGHRKTKGIMKSICTLRVADERKKEHQEDHDTKVPLEKRKKQVILTKSVSIDTSGQNFVGRVRFRHFGHEFFKRFIESSDGTERRLQLIVSRTDCKKYATCAATKWTTKS